MYWYGFDALSLIIQSLIQSMSVLHVHSRNSSIICLNRRAAASPGSEEDVRLAAQMVSTLLVSPDQQKVPKFSSVGFRQPRHLEKCILEFSVPVENQFAVVTMGRLTSFQTYLGSYFTLA